MTQTVGNQEFMMDLIRELAQSRRDRPGSEQNFQALNDGMKILANALLTESSECVREACIDVAVNAIRVACDGCFSVEKKRQENGLDPVTAHMFARANNAAAAH